MRGHSRGNALLNPDFRDILSAFIDARVEFLVVGGYAMAAHRLPRATKDLDLWVRLSAMASATQLRGMPNFRRSLPDVLDTCCRTPKAFNSGTRTFVSPAAFHGSYQRCLEQLRSRGR